MQLPAEKILTQYIKFLGGIDSATPVLSVNPGACLDAMNYQPGLFGGYERVDPFERSDGRAAPSDGVYYYATATFSATPSVGQWVIGGTSGAIGVVSAVSTTGIELTRITGTFVTGENFGSYVTGFNWIVGRYITAFTSTPYGTFTSAPTLRGYTDGLSDAIALNAAADIYRALIDRPPGSGSVRGGHVYKGVCYAFRDSFDGLSSVMSKQTSTGWQPVSLGEEISFTAGDDTVVDGMTLTQGTATATVSRVVQTTSATSPARVGRLILTNRTGNFTAGLANGLTLSGASAQIALAPGGRYECVNYNFAASTDSLKMYGADGANRAFEFDANGVYVPITTGMVVDTPIHVRAHKQQLFLSFRGSSQNSGINFPYRWTTVTGAAEIGIGDDITGYSVMPGDALAISARNSTFQLVGSSVSDFNLKTITMKHGAIRWTVQEMGKTYALDDQGVLEVTQTIYQYGNFSEEVITRRAQRVIDAIRSKVTASAIYRVRNQYRVYGNNGTGFILSMGVDARGNPLAQITEFDYNSGRTTNLINVTCAWTGEDTTGKDVIYFGADNGYVYQCEKGTSFDGNDIEAFIRLPFGDARSPEVRKRYRKVRQEMSAQGYCSLNFYPEFSYGDEVISTHSTITQVVQGLGGYYDSPTALWDAIFYDARIVATPEFKINGTGRNMSLLYYSKSDFYASHVLQGAVIHYSPRRQER